MPINQSAFESIYDRYHILVYNLALNYVQNIEDAEEIAQDVFLKVYQSLEKFNNNAAIKTWIYRITINSAIDSLKKKQRQKYRFVFGKKETEAVYLASSNFEHPGILMESQENASLLFGAINELSPNQKTAFLLSKLDGLSHQEISVIMNLSISSVESLVFRAKTALREKLNVKFEMYRKKK